MPSNLRADVFVAPAIPFVFRGSTPGNEPKWSPTPATLISGNKEAVLVDALWTVTQANDLADWIETVIPGKRLTTVYITHGHGDHFFGLAILMKRFPGLRAVATPKVIEYMKQSLEPRAYQRSWENLFPGQIQHENVIAEAMNADLTINLEGHILRAVEVGQSDTHDTTFLHVPDLKMVVAGDIVYNDVHPFLVEANTHEKRQGWIASLRKIAELRPETVIAGHKRPGAVDGSNNIDATIEYIETFEKLLETAGSADQLFNEMKARYPTRINDQALRGSCKAGWGKRKPKL